MKQLLNLPYRYDHVDTPSSDQLFERITLIGIAILILLLAFINLPYAPRTWFDEGSHLHVPKTLIQYGVYADRSSEGFRYFGPTVGVGPTVMLPIAGVFQLTGIGLLQGRLVISCYLLLAFAAFSLLVQRLYGLRVALLALALLLASRTFNYEGMIEYGRQVLGEVPGIAFLLLGCLAWVYAVSSIGGRHLWFTLLAGLGFGLALVTKNQFVLIVPPTLVLIGFLDWVYYRSTSWILRLLPVIIAVGCFGVWTLIQLTFLGPGNFTANIAQTRQAAGGAIFVFNLQSTLRAARYLIQVYLGLFLPALLYGLWRCRRPTATALAELLVVVMPTLWIGWYLISLGWPRYAFPAVVFGAIAAARLISDLFTWLAGRQPLFSWLLTLYVAIVIVLPLLWTLNGVLSPDRSAQQMAAYMNSNVPLATVVETWEPEMGLLTDHTYHYPPIEQLDPAVRHQWLGGPPVAYKGLADNPPFLLLGPFGSYTTIYADVDQHYTREASFGPYALYRLNH